MNTEQARFNMVEQQIRPWEVIDQTVLDLLYAVRRERFVPPQYRAIAFADLEVPLGEGEHMWAPKIEARVLQALAPRKTERALEIGTGSGYFAALLAHLVHEVITVEIRQDLRRFAERNLASEGIDNVTVREGDGAQGWSEGDPFDLIVLSGSTPVLPQAFLAQLKPGGRLFVVVGESPVMAARLVTRVRDDAVHAVDLFETDLPPLANAARPPGFRF